jgi:uracil-DNA glycosylase
MNVEIESSWKEQLADEFEEPYFKELSDFVDGEYKQNKCFPLEKDLFNAFNLCPFHKVKVVIIGQDPYPGEGQAHGLSFSVNDGVPFPPSLNNIFKGICYDLKTPTPTSGNLTRWAEQGVLLLNTILTVCPGDSNSHKGKGWEQFTNAVIKRLNNECNSLVFMLWGVEACKKASLIDADKHLVLEARHPAAPPPKGGYPKACKGFWPGYKLFSQANKYLSSSEKTPINWE